MAGSKRKTGKKALNKTIKQKLGIIAVAISAAVIVISAIADLTGLMSYDQMMVMLHLRNPAVSDAEVKVHFIDVGQGDSILIMSGTKNVLIDAGESECGEEVAAYIHEQNVSKLDYVIATHPHSDHIGGLPYVISEFDVGKVIVPVIPPDQTPATAVYTKFLEAVRDNGLSLTPAVSGNEYELDSSVLKILGPCSDEYEDYNNYSVVAELIHDENTFIFMGDAEKESENEMLDAGVIPDIDVLKAGHHGSNSSSSLKFLKATTPEYTVIMCGSENQYNHPGQRTMKELSEFTDKIFRTDQQGSIVIESDGKNYNTIIKEG